MPKKFVSEPLEPAMALAPEAPQGGHMEPQLPHEFSWRGEPLQVKGLVRAWRSSKSDRGDVYLKRHWFEFDTPDGRRAVVYFDRAAKAGQPHWWLYTIDG